MAAQLFQKADIQTICLNGKRSLVFLCKLFFKTVVIVFAHLYTCLKEVLISWQIKPCFWRQWLWQN